MRNSRYRKPDKKHESGQPRDIFVEDYINDINDMDEPYEEGNLPEITIVTNKAKKQLAMNDREQDTGAVDAAPEVSHTIAFTVPDAEELEDERSFTHTLSITGAFAPSAQEEETASSSKGRKRKKKDKGEHEDKLSTFKLLFEKRKKPRNYFINLLFTTLKLLVAVIIIFGVSGAGALLGLAKAYVESIPSLDFTIIGDQDQTSLIYDANGNVLSRFFGSENREWVPIDEIPKQLQDAFVAVEDVRFWRHAGVDFKRLFGSFILNMSSDSVQGGSTITQQLIKNTLLSTEQTYKRKIREAYLAMQMEKKYKKEQILEAYLNTIPLYGSNYGVKTAAMDFFGKELSELTLKECACLAGLTQNPSRYNPRLNYYVRHKPENTDNRIKKVLREMYENGFISFDDYNKALEEPLNVLEKSPIQDDRELLPAIDYVIYDVTTQLLKLNNMADTAANRNRIENLIRTEGYNIYSTIDPDMQKSATNSVENFKGYPEMRYDSDKYTIIGRNPDGTAIRLIQPQASSVIIDYRTGQIKAMVNGRQTSSGRKEFNRPYQSTMPVGSSIKPIAVYGPALDKGRAPGTIYYNQPTPIQGWGTEKGYPSNYGNSGYNGNVTMREGLRRSLNTVAAQILMYDVGIETAKNYLINLGVNPDHINADGPGLALGSSGITPLEMAGAYTAIANLGEYIQPISFTKITDRNGNVILDMVARQERRQVFKQSSAWLLIDMLYTNLNTAGNISQAVFKGQTIYGKTGTNSDQRGVFFTGFTGYYVASCWVGSDAYKPLISSATGAKYAAPLWHDIMEPIHKGLENKPATTVTPEELGIKKLKFCKYSGRLATSACPETVEDYGVESELILDPCPSHVELRICTQTGGIATDLCPSYTVKKFKLLPPGTELEYLYHNHPDIFSRYYGSVDTIQGYSPCTVHTNQWLQDEEEKLALRPQVRRLLTQAEEKLNSGTLSQEQYQQLQAYYTAMKQAYDHPDNLTFAQYKKYYDDLYSYYDALGN